MLRVGCCGLWHVDFSKERGFFTIAIYCTLFHLGVSIGIDRM